MENLTFDIKEIIYLVGLTQAVYVLVYMALRAGEVKRAAIPFFYFFILSLAFFSGVVERFAGDITVYYNFIQWALWSYGPPLSVLVVIQVAQITRLPRLINFWVLLVVPAAFFISLQAQRMSGGCDVLTQCHSFDMWLGVTGVFAGAVSLLTIWVRRDVLGQVYAGKASKDRYWLILTIIIMNILLLSFMFFSALGKVTPSQEEIIRAIIGSGLVYLVSTSIFRIYPQSLDVSEYLPSQKNKMSAQDRSVAKSIDDLMTLDKVYHDPGYSRADLARELDVSEAVISRVINRHYKKSFPQILNECRVEDAKRLLMQTDEPVNVIASEVGFNSTQTFNRVFKDMTGESPSSFRKKSA
ncbi:MAG: helix-turn-helix transcriptional regulator [Alphaproteobacteria bacterium]|mgnify:CR=1 FL=1|jgi:AraC-like DNA-binding protein|nr:helix-turn-helix transcriptional regulator [Alphaproteobacteria bacterium]MDP7222445.1 helix-turn-helix transcriptional regulator [Alphaproteobacteria bacterium]